MRRAGTEHQCASPWVRSWAVRCQRSASICSGTGRAVTIPMHRNPRSRSTGSRNPPRHRHRLANSYKTVRLRESASSSPLWKPLSSATPSTLIGVHTRTARFRRSSSAIRNTAAIQTRTSKLTSAVLRSRRRSLTVAVGQARKTAWTPTSGGMGCRRGRESSWTLELRVSKMAAVGRFSSF
jgi:hypothetical protein